MNYLWTDFNIKTFPAETIVFKDGIFIPELSTLPDDTKITKKYDLPVHIIHIGEIFGKFDINYEISAENQPVFLTAKLTTKKPVFFNIFIKNTGKFSEFKANIIIQNFDTLEINEKCTHLAENTGIFIKNRVVAHEKSSTKLSGIAKIEKDCKNCESDIIFSAMADDTAKIIFTPAQKISSIPKSADHGAAIYHPSTPQIQFLRGAGLSKTEIKKVLRESFTNDFF
jgi:hypothetical protein